MTTIHERFGRFVVVSSAAKMPSSCRGRYRHVAVMQTADVHTTPTQIRDAIRYWPVRTWWRVNVGKTHNCAYARALLEAEAYAHELFLDGGVT